MEVLLSYASYDIVLHSYSVFPKGTLTEFEERSCHTKKEIGACLVASLYTGFSMPWAKLYRREIIIKHSLFFDESLFSGEDTLWVSQYLAQVKSMQLLSYCGYQYNKGGKDGLSIQGISEKLLDYTVRQIIQSYEKLESLFQVNLMEWKLNVGMYFFHRYVVTLSEKSLLRIYYKLRINSEKEFLRPIFYDRNIVLKGMRLKFFNALVRGRYYGVLALYVKNQKRYL